jgi:predicted SPOUT superfamily RNA methylase MTH1
MAAKAMRNVFTVVIPVASLRDESSEVHSCRVLQTVARAASTFLLPPYLRRWDYADDA